MRRAVKSPYRITLFYGAASYPYSTSRPHIGTDYAHGIPGVKQTVYAPESGVIKHTTQKLLGTGLHLYVNGKHRHTFGHLSARSVADNTKVKEGDIIGKTGQTGYASGVHLHHVYYPNGDGKHADFEQALREEELMEDCQKKLEWNRNKVKYLGEKIDRKDAQIKELEASNARLTGEVKSLEGQVEACQKQSWLDKLIEWLKDLRKDK